MKNSPNGTVLVCLIPEKLHIIVEICNLIRAYVVSISIESDLFCSNP